MPLTDKRSDVAGAIIGLLSSTTSSLVPKPQDVFYGDEKLVFKLPAISVAPGGVRKELEATSLRTRNDFTIEIICYHGREGSIGVTRRAADEYAEQVEDELHKDLTLGGMVVHGHVSSVEPGHVGVNNILYVATQLVWTGLSKTRLQ